MLNDNKQINKQKDKLNIKTINNKVILSSVEKKFHKKKPITSSNTHSNGNHSRNNAEENKIMSFDMSNKNRFPIFKKNQVKKNESSNYQCENNSKNKYFSDHSIDKTPETRKHRLKKAESIESFIENKPIRVYKK